MVACSAVTAASAAADGQARSQQTLQAQPGSAGMNPCMQILVQQNISQTTLINLMTSLVSLNMTVLQQTRSSTQLSVTNRPMKLRGVEFVCSSVWLPAHEKHKIQIIYN
jgi:hypothetical protein